MCISTPKIPAPIPPAQLQAMQAPKDLTSPDGTMRDKLRRRGMFASIFTGPSGITASPSVTGTSGGMTGG
jgi:hypothetical protein